MHTHTHTHVHTHTHTHTHTPHTHTHTYNAHNTEVQAQSRLSVYVDSVLYNSGTAISCRPGATLLFQCEYLVADQPVFQPFPPQLCYQVAAGCVEITTSSPTPPWSSGKLRSNSTISGVASGTTRYYSCQYTTPSVSSYVTILFTDSAGKSIYTVGICARVSVLSAAHFWCTLLVSRR